MCRGIDHGNRRCPSDTNEARRLRDHNLKAKRMYSPLLMERTEPHFLTVEEVAPVTELDPASSIKADIAALKTLEDPKEIDITINRIGSGIENLAETKFGAPADIVIADAVKIERTARLAAAEVFQKRVTEAIALNQSTEAELLATGINYQTHSFNAEREKAWEKTYPEKYAVLVAAREEQKAAAAAFAAFKKDLPDIETLPSTALFRKRNQAIHLALEEAGVEFANPNTLNITENSHAGATKTLKEALAFYPQRWIDNSNAHSLKTGSPLQVKKSNGRAHYSDGNDGHSTAELTITSTDTGTHVGGGPGVSIALHEFAHRVEDTTPRIKQYEDAFLKRRAGFFDGSDEKPSNIYVGRATEKGYKDNFSSHYMGKVYDNGSREILSMGMETLFAGTHDSFLGSDEYAPDVDYKRFVLGVLASSAGE